jgi:hypothetical protein
MGLVLLITGFSLATSAIILKIYQKIQAKKLEEKLSNADIRGIFDADEIEDELIYAPTSFTLETVQVYHMTTQKDDPFYVNVGSKGGFSIPVGGGTYQSKDTLSSFLSIKSPGDNNKIMFKYDLTWNNMSPVNSSLSLSYNKANKFMTENFSVPIPLTQSANVEIKMKKFESPDLLGKMNHNVFIGSSKPMIAKKMSLTKIKKYPNYMGLFGVLIFGVGSVLFYDEHEYQIKRYFRNLKNKTQ